MNKYGHEAQLRAFPTPGYLGFSPHLVLPFSFETVPLLRRAQFLLDIHPREVLLANQDKAHSGLLDRRILFTFLQAGRAVQYPHLLHKSWRLLILVAKTELTGKLVVLYHTPDHNAAFCSCRSAKHAQCRSSTLCPSLPCSCIGYFTTG